MMAYSRGDIVLVNLNPQRKNEAGKIRPCIVVSSTVANEILDLITIVPCTTNLIGEGLFRIKISKREKLNETCEAMIEQVRGVSKERIKDILTVTTKEELEKIEKGLKSLLEI